MTKFELNKNYLMKDHEPWFPIMGEIHYSRYPKQYWRESLYKMKSGGVEVVSTYAIWIHHEEIEGEYDFSGNKDLRSFAQTCAECGLFLMLRIGPWTHGEARNGGFPDWLLKKGYQLRHNDPRYLAEVKKYYTKLYDEVDGLFVKDGGPIIGIQIENELGHCGGACGDEGEEHIRTLYQMAVELGFEVPFYTATGWGGAATGGLLPVMGGYPEAPWDQSITELEPNGNYVFTYERNDHNIGNDFGVGEGVTFRYDDFPYLTAELGGGLQVTHHRRPVTKAEDIGAMTLVKLGSGVNLLGYYMYHGGSNPKGKLTSLQESREDGYSDLPEFNYDFRAPIREYGQMSDTLRELKLYAMFAKDFGSELCTMPAFLSEDNPVIPGNLTDLRYSVRHNGRSGYLFVNNFQRRYSMKEHSKVMLTAALSGETVTFPEISIKDKDYFFLPFHMKIGDAVLITALVTPLCILKNEKTAYVFYGDRSPMFEISGELNDTRLISISRKDALNAWKVNLKKEHLIISESAIVQTDQGIEIISRDQMELKVYPDFDTTPSGWQRNGMDGEFTVYKKEIDELLIPVNVTIRKETPEKKIYEIRLENTDKLKEETKEGHSVKKALADDCFLKLHYAGDQAKLYLDGEQIADHFYTGEDWEIGLKRFGFPEKLTLEIYPLAKEAKVFLEQWPVMKDGIACELSSIITEVEYCTEISG